MAGLRNIAIRWYRKVFAAPAGSDIREEGLDTVLDGNSAVALSEAGIASHAVLGGSFPCADADSIWLTELEHGGTNLFGEALSAQTTEGPRGIVAATTGLRPAGPLLGGLRLQLLELVSHVPRHRQQTGDDDRRFPRAL